MKRRWVGACRHCDTEHEAANGKAWRRWYKLHLRSCEKFREKYGLPPLRVARG